MSNKENNIDYYGLALELEGKGHLPRSTAPNVWQRVLEDMATAGNCEAAEILHPTDPVLRAWRQQIYGVPEGQQPVVLGSPWVRPLGEESRGDLPSRHGGSSTEAAGSEDPRIQTLLERLKDDPQTYQNAKRFLRGLDRHTDHFVRDHRSQGEGLETIVRADNRNMAIMYLEGVIQISTSSRQARR